MRSYALGLTTVLVSALVATSACNGPASINADSAQPVPAVTSSSPTATPTPVPPPLASPTAIPTATPTADPPVPTCAPAPRKGTIAWYVCQLPHFGSPPAPAGVPALSLTGPARQVSQVAVAGQRVAFITIDDGWLKDPDFVTLLRAAHIPFTMFLTTNAIASNPAYFRSLQALGGVIEDHTISHPKLNTLSYAQQRTEICTNRTTLTKLYGRAPVIMRAPYGLYNADTLKAAASCGIRANVSWNEYAITGTVSWQRPGGIHPGDMVLMHFDKYFKDNFLATLREFQRSHITPALLEDYLVVPAS